MMALCSFQLLVILLSDNNLSSIYKRVNISLFIDLNKFWAAYLFVSTNKPHKDSIMFTARFVRSAILAIAIKFWTAYLSVYTNKFLKNSFAFTTRSVSSAFLSIYSSRDFFPINHESRHEEKPWEHGLVTVASRRELMVRNSWMWTLRSKLYVENHLTCPNQKLT
jgi:hypothetical protein